MLDSIISNRAAVGMVSFGFWIFIANDALFVIHGRWFEEGFWVSFVSFGSCTVGIGIAKLLLSSRASIIACFYAMAGIGRMTGVLAEVFSGNWEEFSWLSWGQRCVQE